MVTRTGGFLPEPSASTTSGGTRMPVAVFPPSSTVVRNLMGRILLGRRSDGKGRLQAVLRRGHRDRGVQSAGLLGLGRLRPGEQEPLGVRALQGLQHAAL